MEKAKIILMGILGFVLMSFPQSVLAQNEVVPAAETQETAVEDTADQAADNPDDGVNYSYGSIVRVSAAEMELLEYDYNYETDEEVEINVVYAIDSATAYENIKSWEELKEKDDVEVYYKEQDGKKMAVTIIKEMPYEDEGLEGDDLGTDEGANLEGAPVENALPVEAPAQ